MQFKNFNMEEFEKEWKEKEVQLLNSKEYINANKMEKEEMLYLFDCSKMSAAEQLSKQIYFKTQDIKNSFIKIYNYCKTMPKTCIGCMFVDDGKCMLDKIDNYKCEEDILQLINKNLNVKD